MSVTKKYFTGLNSQHQSWNLQLIVLAIAILIPIVLLVAKEKAPAKQKPSKLNRGAESIKRAAFLLGADVRLQRFIAAHSYLESGRYSSSIYRSCNNLFGMGRVYSRKTTQVGYKDFGKRANEPRYMGCYSGDMSSIEDWFLWFEMWGKSVGDLNNMDTRQILTFMKSKKYFVLDLEEYITRVKRVELSLSSIKDFS